MHRGWGIAFGCLAQTSSILRQIDSAHRAVRVNVALNYRPPVTCPICGLGWVEYVTPIAVANGQKELLAEDREVVKIRNRNVSPALNSLNRIHPIHPSLRVGHHDSATQKLAHLGTGQQPLLDQHLLTGCRRQVAELVMRTFS